MKLILALIVTVMIASCTSRSDHHGRIISQAQTQGLAYASTVLQQRYQPEVSEEWIRGLGEESIPDRDNGPPTITRRRSRVVKIDEVTLADVRILSPVYEAVYEWPIHVEYQTGTADSPDADPLWQEPTMEILVKQLRLFYCHERREFVKD